MNSQAFLRKLEATIAPVRKDRRDEWPSCYPEHYQLRPSISKSAASTVYPARAARKFGTAEEKSCIVKVVHVGAALGRIEDVDEAKAEELKAELSQNVLMELLLLTRVRHRNILHSHLVYLHRENLVLVMPQCYSMHSLVERYIRIHNGEPVPVQIVGPVVRQICAGLAYLHRMSIVHHELSAESVLLTRGGTVKLGSCNSARFVLDGKCALVPTEYNQEFMSPEMRGLARGRPRCEQARASSYDVSTDIWSVGVLVLHMVSLFPQKRRLPVNFADIMWMERITFGHLIRQPQMMTIRDRLEKSTSGVPSAHNLKNFLNNHFLQLDPEKRVKAADVETLQEITTWCKPCALEDKKTIFDQFILKVDFANKDKLERSGSNYDWLESKDIPIEMYWTDEWKRLEEALFAVTFRFCPSKEQQRADVERPQAIISLGLRSDHRNLIEVLQDHVNRGDIEPFDLIPLECATNEMLCSLIQGKKAVDVARRDSTSTTITLPSLRSVRISVYLAE